jgi:hypothetical protein
VVRRTGYVCRGYHVQWWQSTKDFKCVALTGAVAG